MAWPGGWAQDPGTKALQEAVMAIAERTAETTWEGSLASGSGTIRPASGALGELPVTWASRT